MNRIRHGKKNVTGKQKISSKCHQLVEKCLHVSISYVVQPTDFDQMESVMSA